MAAKNVGELITHLEQLVNQLKQQDPNIPITSIAVDSGGYTDPELITSLSLDVVGDSNEVEFQVTYTPE